MKKVVIGAFFLTGLINAQTKTERDSLEQVSTTIEEIELFGERGKQPKKLEIITRIPLKPKDQIQNIAVISDKAISEIGALSISDVARNISGVTLFATYGDYAESLSIRGYRGVPTLKNGVMMLSDFRRPSIITDMQGIESVQIIRGAAAITQGLGTSLGSAGGVINLVTKTPRFINSTNVGFRYGSWDTYRPTLDFQRVLDKAGKVAVRLNIAYQNNKSFADHIRGEKFYINPSVAFRPDSHTNIVLEMDYLYNERTPNMGTVNLADNGTYAIYDLPKNKYLGFKGLYTKDRGYSYMISADRKLTDHLKVRVAYMSSDYNTDEKAYSLTNVTEGRGRNRRVVDYNLRERRVTREYGEDYNKVFQADFIGQNIQTGILKHTFQLGFDWKQSHTISHSYGDNDNKVPNRITGEKEPASYVMVDTINVLQDINHTFPADSYWNKLTLNRKEYKTTPTYGLMAQEVMEIGKYARVFLGVRYSSFNGNVKSIKNAWDPSFGLMFSPHKNINVYGSYTTTTDLRTSNNPTPDGGTIGPSITKQWEAGIKSDWFNERLKANVNFFLSNLNNFSYALVDKNNVPIKNNRGERLYENAGDVERKGVEIDIIGKILPELEIMAGYSFLEAKYVDSPAYVNGSTPFMTPRHTANGWLNYTFKEGALKGLNFGGGIYFVDKRPSNEYTTKIAVHDTTPGVKPYYFKAYTTINAQIGYTYKNASIKVFLNNLSDSIGYVAYARGGFINRTAPRNFAIQLNYKF